MISNNDLTCPRCGGNMRYYDSVKRIVRTRRGVAKWILIRRFACNECNAIHRELPESLVPFKHYEAHIIEGFVSGRYSSYDLDFEDYPCETTIKQWCRKYH